VPTRRRIAVISETEGRVGLRTGVNDGRCRRFVVDERGGGSAAARRQRGQQVRDDGRRRPRHPVAVTSSRPAAAAAGRRRRTPGSSSADALDAVASAAAAEAAETGQGRRGRSTDDGPCRRRSCLQRVIVKERRENQQNLNAYLQNVQLTFIFCTLR